MNREDYVNLEKNFVSRCEGLTLHCPTEEDRTTAMQVFGERGYKVTETDSSLDSSRFGLRIERRLSS